MGAWLKILKTDLTNLVTNPMWAFYCMGFPFLLVMILGFLTQGAYGKAVSSYDYYGITMMLFIILNTSTIAANSFMEERIKSGNMRIMFAPIRPFYIHFSKFTATVIYATLCHLLVGSLLVRSVGVNYGGSKTILIILLAFLTECFASALGILLCCIFKTESTTNMLLSTIVTMMALLGGLFFPMDGMGILAKISYVSPVKWLTSAVFQLIYDANMRNYLPACLILIGTTVVMIGLATRFFRTEDYL